MINLQRLRWVKHASCMRKNSEKNLNHKSEKKVFENLETYRRIILKCNLKWCKGMKWFHLTQDSNY